MLECKHLPFSECELKFAGENTGTFEGYASVFDVKDRQGDIITKGAYSSTLKKREEPVFMLFGHDTNRVIGKWTDVAEDSKGLHVRGEFTPGHTDAQNARASAQHGAITGLSVGIRVTDSEKAEDARLIKQADLVEISLVAMPANQHARIDAGTVKALIENIESARDAELILRDAGFSKSQSTAFVSCVKSLGRGDPGSVAELEAEIKELRDKLVEAKTALLRSQFSFTLNR